MRNAFVLVAAAALAVGSMTLADDQGPAKTPTPVPSASTSTPGEKTSGTIDLKDPEAKESRGARHLLARIVDDATTAGRYNDLTMQLTTADRQRIAKSDKPDMELDRAVSQFQKDWKAKYGSDFNVQNNLRGVFAADFVHVTGPSIYDDAQTAGERITPSGNASGSGSTNSNEAGPKATGSGAAAIDSSRQQSGGPTGTSGNPTLTDSREQNPSSAGPKTDGSGASALNPRNNRNANQGTAAGTDAAPSDRTTNTSVAGPVTDGSGAASVSGGVGNTTTPRDKTTVTIPASHGVPAVTLNLVSEGGKLRLDIPDSIDAATFHANLSRHLQMACQDKANWPTDANEASRVVAHHVLLALTDTTTTK